MSRFFNARIREIAPYVPGEQPQDKSYIKLNTNESPLAPSPVVQQALAGFDAADLRLYPDPDARQLRGAVAKAHGLTEAQVFAGGGSDEVLAYSFMAFFNPGDRVYFPDITYGFYQVYADLFGLRAVKVPLRADFTVALEDYYNAEGHIFIANPNAPTGICLTPAQIEGLLQQNPNRLVIVDEAYIDFAQEGYTCVPLIEKYDNLLVTQTFSKSRGLAGIRLGFGFGQPALLDGLERIKYSFNPYNIDRVSLCVGIAAAGDSAYLRTAAGSIAATRDKTAAQLRELGFRVLESQANFLFAEPPGMSGKDFFLGLKESGILVRYFAKPRIDSFVRITIGLPEEMQKLVEQAKILIGK
jgi:histidinol-phosphate aminotransferase